MDVLNCDTGFTIEVDLEIPTTLHDLLDDLPLAPENKTVDEATPYMMELWDSVNDGKKYRPCQKLLLSHKNKEHYVIHFALLQFFMEMGVKVTKVHRAIQYAQSSFFEPYISHNSAKRQAANTEQEKDFWKLKNNCEFFFIK